MNMKDLLVQLWKDEEGQDLIEYALITALLALVIAAAFPPVVAALQGVFNRAITCLGPGGC